MNCSSLIAVKLSILAYIKIRPSRMYPEVSQSFSTHAKRLFVSIGLWESLIMISTNFTLRCDEISADISSQRDISARYPSGVFLIYLLEIILLNKFLEEEYHCSVDHNNIIQQKFGSLLFYFKISMYKSIWQCDYVTVLAN